jgi:hypothetical protein
MDKFNGAWPWLMIVHYAEQEYNEVAKRSSKLDFLWQQKEPKAPKIDLGFFLLP